MCHEWDIGASLASLQPTAGLGGACVLDGAGHRALGREQGCYFLGDLPSPFPSLSATSVPSPSGSVPGASAPFRPLFNDFGPPSMGYVQAMKPPGSQGSQSTYTDLLSVIEEMGKEIRPTYAGSKSAMERLKRGTRRWGVGLGVTDSVTQPECAQSLSHLLRA
ncbi:Cyclin-dependent kinase 2-associated protein 2 [Platysternon megacephalum]|uniref:Cyclin-dependent kinase 2-associated protein 2 n=1 Tax=Platysternon megacephalum TaxID=55544 RepID=A0A4D9DMF2_9SAUR|nr:Cyclin-dependent kinase 2-associated protein 2 [Platysternon megacephalum]